MRSGLKSRIEALAMGAALLSATVAQSQERVHLIPQLGFGEAWSVAVSPNGRLAASGGSEDKTVRIWDLATGRQIQILETGQIDDLGFTKDSRSVLVSVTAQEIRLMDIATGKQLRSFSCNAGALAVSTDGRLLLSADYHNAVLWNLSSGAKLTEFVGHKDQVEAVALSPDGKHALTGSADATARLWSAATGKLERIFTGRKGKIFAVAFSPDGQKVMTGSGDDDADNTVRIWDLTSGKQILAVPLKHSVRFVSFTPDGRRLLIDDASIEFGDIRTGRVVEDLDDLPDFPIADYSGLALSKDGKFLLVGETNRILMFDPPMSDHFRALQGYTNEVRSVAFSTHHGEIAIGNKDGTARLWDEVSGQQVSSFEHWHSSFPSEVESVAFSPDNAQLLTASYGGPRLWNIATGKQTAAFVANNKSFSSAAFSPDGRLLIGGNLDGIATLWDAASAKKLREFKHISPPASLTVAFTPTGRYVLTGSHILAGVRLWDAESGVLVRNFPGDQGIFTPDGRYVLTKTGSGLPALWEAESGKQVSTFDHDLDFYELPMAASKDGRYIITSNPNLTNYAFIWDAATGHELKVLEGHLEPVNSVAISDDGKFVLTWRIRRHHSPLGFRFR